MEIIDDYKIIIIPPAEIDDAVRGKDGLNLNWLEAVKSAEIINSLKPDEVIMDCPSTNVKAFSSYVRERLNVKTKLKAEHKADLVYPIVSAASVIAKVTRDGEIQKIKQKIGEDVGSGYPADPRTKEFLEKNYKKHANIFRQSWSTYKNVAAKREQGKLGEF